MTHVFGLLEESQGPGENPHRHAQLHATLISLCTACILTPQLSTFCSVTTWKWNELLGIFAILSTSFYEFKTLIIQNHRYNSNEMTGHFNCTKMNSANYLCWKWSFMKTFIWTKVKSCQCQNYRRLMDDFWPIRFKNSAALWNNKSVTKFWI